MVKISVRKVLFLPIQASDQMHQLLSDRIQAIKLGLQQLNPKPGVELIKYWGQDLQRILLDHHPQIVHLYGFQQEFLESTGIPMRSAKRELSAEPEPEEGFELYEKQQQRDQRVSAIADLIKLFADQIQCVVLDGYESDTQVNQFGQIAPMVLALSSALANENATSFVVRFYSALTPKTSIPEAYQQTCSRTSIVASLLPIFHSH